jgi:hypothetical protein
MAQPTPNEGAKQKGLASVQAAADTLSMALADLGSMTPEGQAVVSALKALSKFTSATSNELVPAQLMELFRAQQPSPMTQMMGGGGGAPQGAPQAPAPQPV